jgi:hypothetical protein
MRRQKGVESHGRVGENVDADVSVPVWRFVLQVASFLQAFDPPKEDDEEEEGAAE